MYSKSAGSRDSTSALIQRVYIRASVPFRNLKVRSPCATGYGYRKKAYGYDWIRGNRARNLKLNDLHSVRTICLGEDEQEVCITASSRYGNGSVAAVFIAACGRKCLKSRLFRAKEKGRVQIEMKNTPKWPIFCALARKYARRKPLSGMALQTATRIKCKKNRLKTDYTKRPFGPKHRKESSL